MLNQLKIRCGNAIPQISHASWCVTRYRKFYRSSARICIAKRPFFWPLFVDLPLAASVFYVTAELRRRFILTISYPS
ncbi:hypothetical protein OKW34_003874 [Paraburkholderia youngii]|uniref:hypothetical protein n=1 Tax=Paraburkholderia TaxID=1822464 RepID=UPI0034CF1579